MHAARRAIYERISTALASCSDSDLAGLIDATPAHGVGVGGGSLVIDVDGVAVFAKRIPLTDLELAHPGSTANLFDMPAFCHYGIGSPGLGAWRELAANRIATEGVVDGETEQFPLLYHWRVLPGRPPVADEYANIEVAVYALGRSPAVRSRLEALAAASHSLVLFLEFIPCALADWVRDDPVGKAGVVERQLLETVGFLQRRGLLHMDGHFGNLRVDGERICLVDFGLALSPSFDLSEAERDFARHNATHDAGYAAMVLVNWLVTAVCGVPVPANGGPVARNEYVQRCAAGQVPDDIPPTIAAILARHAPAAARLNSFYWRLFGGDLRAEYPVV